MHAVNGTDQSTPACCACTLCILHSSLPDTWSYQLLQTGSGLLAANLGLAASSSILLSFTCVNTYYLDKLRVFHHILIYKKL